MDSAMLLTLIGAGLLGGSVWWYRRNIGQKTESSGCVLWILWVVFGSVSLVILAASGPEAVLLAGVATWVFCVAGTVLGSRLLARTFRSSQDVIWTVTVVFVGGLALLAFVLMWTSFQSSLLNTS